jgi:Holliday junction resolvase RusA-like endonuclease
MTGWTFELHGEPFAWKRAGKRGKKHFTAADQRRFMDDVRQAARRAGAEVIAGPVFVHIICYFRPPESYSNKRRTAMIGTFRHVGKDVDNLAKAILDALQKQRRKKGQILAAPGIAYQNDSQVSRLIVDSVYDWHPRTNITIRPATDADLPDAARAERAMLEAAE